MINAAMPSDVKFRRSNRRNLAALARGAAAILLILAGLLGTSQPSSAADGDFVNLSTRALVGTGTEVMIGGFIIEDGPRRVLIQARGPELANDGISNALADPVLTVIRQSDGMELMVNDNWEDSQGQLVSDLWGGSPNLAAGSLSSAVVLTLDPGRYTAQVDGKNGTGGVAMVEVYGIDSAGADGKFVNLSTRALVGTGTEVMIGGFIIEDGARRVLIQARGPELANDGISNALADPVLTVLRLSDGMVLMVNDDWEDSQGKLVSDLWGGSPNLAAGSLSSAVVLTLDPGRYTARVDGKNGTAGIALVEVLRIDLPDAVNPDREALTALYNATGGANWPNKDNWLSDVPLDQWHGVMVDDNGRVVELRLGDNQLSGAIPPQLGNLANLRVLELGDNQLTGSIPPELGSLTSLTLLNLGRNALSGNIPPELGNLTSLQTLDLAYGDNALSGVIPPELGNLANLTWLRLAGNRLSGSIPPELGQLGNLERLDLDHNDLSGSVPSWLGNLTKLYALDLGSNQFSGNIPPELGNLTNLRSWLYLFDNQLSGAIPPELGNLTNLEDLQLYGNQLSGPIPPELGNLTNLTVLYLFDNSDLSGSLPGSFTDLGALVDLYLSGTGLCAPTDDAFQTWLQGIPNKLGVVNCADGDGSVMPMIYWTDWNGGKVQRGNLDGSGVEDLVTGLQGTDSIALDLGAGRCIGRPPRRARFSERIWTARASKTSSLV